MALIKKLTKIGNSWGVLLPLEVMKMAGIETNSELELQVAEEGLLLSPVNADSREVTNLEDPMDQEVAKATAGFIRRYREDLQKLA